MKTFLIVLVVLMAIAITGCELQKNAGVQVWTPDTTYAQGEIVGYDNGWYVSLVSGNQDHEPGPGLYWAKGTVGAW